MVMRGRNRLDSNLWRAEEEEGGKYKFVGVIKSSRMRWAGV